MRGSKQGKRLFSSLMIFFSFALLAPLQLSTVSAQEVIPPIPIDDDLRHLYEVDFEGDAFTPGMSLALENGLIQPLNLTQTIKTITVKIHWAYADDHTVALRYYINGPHGQVLEELLNDIRLILPEEAVAVSGSRHKAGDPFVPKDTISVQSEFELPEDFSFDGDNIPLVFEVNSAGTRIEALDAQFDLPQPESTAEPKPEGDVFRIEFSVPFYVSVTPEFDPKDATASHDGVTFKITDIAVSPVKLYITSCLEVPHNPGAWSYTETPFNINGGDEGWPIMLRSGGSGDASGCQAYGYEYVWDGEPFTLNGGILDLHTFPSATVFVDMPDEDFEAIIAYIEARGGSVEMMEDRTLISISGDLAPILIKYGYLEHIEGIWEVSVVASAPEETE